MSLKFTSYIQSFLGLNVKKANYPAPWNDVGDDVMGIDRRLYAGLKKTSPDSKLGGALYYTYAAAIHGLHPASANYRVFGVNNAGDCILEFEPPDGPPYIVLYNPWALQLRGAKGKPGKAEPLSIYNPGTGMSDCNEAFLTAIILGEHVRQCYPFVVDPAAFHLLYGEAVALDEQDMERSTAIGENFHAVFEAMTGTSGWKGLCDIGVAENICAMNSAIYYAMKEGFIKQVFGHMGLDESTGATKPVELPIINEKVKAISLLAYEDRRPDLGGEIYKLIGNTLCVLNAEHSVWIEMGDTAPDPVLSADPSRPTSASAEVNIDRMREICKINLSRDLTPGEAAMIPRMGENYVIDAKLATLAERIKSDWECTRTVDLAVNIILEGDAGSGKTAGSKFLADVWGIPRTKITMHPLFESADLIGAFYPIFADVDEWNIADNDKAALSKVRSMVENVSLRTEGDFPKSSDIISSIRRAFTSDEVRAAIREAYGIPSTDEAAFAPDMAWEKLGNNPASVPAVEDVIAEADRRFETAAFKLMTILCEQAENGGVNYRFTLSELMRAFKNGWLVEIQEAASVLRPGVLTQLNSLLEKDGRIELPNGQFIVRHPDTIVVITTNRDYAGNVDLNESLRDRCVYGLKMDNPTAEVMASRAMAQVPGVEKSIVLSAARAVCAVAEEARIKAIKGSFGMRSLIAWMLDLRRGDFSEESFLNRVIYKMTTREDDVELLLTAYRANCTFASKRDPKFAPRKSGR